MINVSIIIPCYNAAPWIREALRSATGQGLDDTEIIVIDDGSADDSAGIVEREFPSVRLVRTKNQGPSKARNLGTKLSSGRFLQYLDADDMLLPGKLKVQSEALKQSGADVAYGNWQKLIETAGHVFIKGEEINRSFSNPEIELFTGDSWCTLGAYLFKREIVKKIGGWNERLPYIQDARFALDCALHGARFVRCPGLMAYYRIRRSDSISTRNPVEHTRDCFRNAFEIEEWWRRHGGINEDRKAALLKAYGYVSRATFRNDKGAFNLVYGHIKRLNPRYIPDGPLHFKLMSRIFGYRAAENFLSWCSRIKSLFKKTLTNS
jgi:glycosyltransferase involved in cell wall biosynthesis